MQPDGYNNIDYEAEHSHVFYEAMKIYKEKSHVRGQMWLEWPPSDKIRELRERIMRIEAAYVNRERAITDDIQHGGLDSVIIEDALDVINYANFLIKQIQRGQSG